MKKFFIFCLVFCCQTLSAKKFHTESWHTANGAKVVFYQAMEVPMLDVSLAFAAGSAYDEAQFGLSALTNHLLNQGTLEMNADAIAEALADTGAQFDANNNREMAVLSLKTLTEPQAFTQAATIFSRIIAHPTFPEDAFEREKKQQLMLIKQAQESPDDVANIAFFQNLYLNHPYGHPINGKSETVRDISLQQVKDFYKKYYVANNAVLVFVGAIDSKKAHDLAEKFTRDLPKGQTAFSIPKAKPLTKAQDMHIPYPSSQTIMRLGQLGIDHHAKNYFPLIVGNYILGGGPLVSRLSLEVRGKQGLTYGIASQFVPMSGDGPFLINFSTKNSQSQQALSMTRNLLKTFVEQGPKPAELIAAKQFLAGSFPLSLSSNRSIANILLKMAFFHLPDNYLDTYISSIQAVSIEDIKTAIQDQISPDKFLTVSVGQS